MINSTETHGTENQYDFFKLVCQVNDEIGVFLPNCPALIRQVELYNDALIDDTVYTATTKQSGAFYWHRLTVISTWMSNHISCKVYDKLLIDSFSFITYSVAPLKFGNG